VTAISRTYGDIFWSNKGMFQNKRIMILGGSSFQIPLIKKAKEMGLYVITCDYLPENPGHQFADEYINISTTAKTAVLEGAKKLNIDAIATLSSDPAIPTVAFVAHALGLRGPRPDAIDILNEKDLFRKQLNKLGLNTPEYFVVHEAEIPLEIQNSQSKFVVKPVDSCGSKGITFSTTNTVELTKAINTALSNSRAQRCILEEYIEGDQIHGDGYLQNGKLIYQYFGDHVFYTKTQNFIPISTQWPCKYSTDIVNEVVNQVEIIADGTGYLNGPVNIEARITKSGTVYIIEVGPRNGGNFVPIIQEHLTGFDFVSRIIFDALGEPFPAQPYKRTNKVGAHYIIHAEKSGKFKRLIFNNQIKDHIFFYNLFKKEGEPVNKYIGSNTTIGVALLEFSSIEERDRLMKDIDHVISVEVDD
jgi:biotin carboxylase